MNNISNVRTKRLTKNILIMILIRGITMLISFLYVPLLLHSMNSVNYGIWLTLTSMVAWVAMFDIGLGNGLRNKLCEALANGDVKLGKSYVSTGYISIALFALLLLILFFIVSPFVSWTDILNAHSVNADDINILVTIVFISFGVQFALNLINSILYALQMPAFSSVILMIGQLLSYIVVLICVTVFDINSLLFLGSAISVIPPIVSLVASLILFNTKYREIRPSISSFQKSYMKDILSVGIKFFLLQLITIVLYQTNNLIITHIVGNEAVVKYNVAYKYMHVLVMVFTIIVTPLWSATTDAYTRGDFDWIRSVSKKLNKITLMIFVLGIVMLCLSEVFYDFWLNDRTVKIDFTTTFILFIYAIAMVLYSKYGYILNGIGKLRVQMIATSILAVVYVPIAIAAGMYWGINGILSVFALNSIINYSWARIQYNKLINNTATGIWAK